MHTGFKINSQMHMGIHCSPYAYCDHIHCYPSMHTGICIQLSCTLWSPYAYGDQCYPYMHIGTGLDFHTIHITCGDSALALPLLSKTSLHHAICNSIRTVCSLNHDTTMSFSPGFTTIFQNSPAPCHLQLYNDQLRCPSTDKQGAITFCIHMIWMWDALNGGLVKH